MSVGDDGFAAAVATTAVIKIITVNVGTIAISYCISLQVH